MRGRGPAHLAPKSAESRRKEHHPADNLILDFCFQNRETVTLCCFGASALRPFVVAAVGTSCKWLMWVKWEEPAACRSGGACRGQQQREGPRSPETMERRHSCRRQGGQPWREEKENRATMNPIPASHAFPGSGTQATRQVKLLWFIQDVEIEVESTRLRALPITDFSFISSIFCSGPTRQPSTGEESEGDEAVSVGGQPHRDRFSGTTGARAGPGVARPACPGPLQSSGSWKGTPTEDA